MIYIQYANGARLTFIDWPTASEHLRVTELAREILATNAGIVSVTIRSHTGVWVTIENIKP